MHQDGSGEAPATSVWLGSAPSIRRRVMVGFAFAIGIVLAVECSLQIIYFATAGTPLFKRMAIPIYAPDPFAGYRLKPYLATQHTTPEYNTMIYSDAQGFRVPRPGVRVQRTKDPSVLRIMLLGPSFAFGWGVNYEDSFAAKIGPLLRANRLSGDRRVEIINAGVPSLAPANQLAWYAAVGMHYSPDLVIQFAYGSLAASPTFDDEIGVTPDGFIFRKSGGLEAKAFAMLKNSALVFYTWTAVTNLRSRSKPTEQIAGAGRPLAFSGRFDTTSAEVTSSMTYYRALASTVVGSHAKLLVLFFPLSYVVHREDLPRWQHLGVTDIARQIEFNRAFCDYLIRQNLDCIDITEDLRAAAATARLYYRTDIHWTAAGNLVAARAVATHLHHSP